MNKYGTASVLAVRLFQNGEAGSPEHAWELATTRIFGLNTPSQKKNCPKNAFLGLCEDGLVKGIPKGIYTRSKKNKKYAVKAVSLLKSNPALSSNQTSLWNIIQDGIPKKHNSQIDVAVSLWNNNLIII
jgi:hypothetical protein